VSSNGAGDLASAILLPLMGLAFTLVGGALVFGRASTTIDGTARTVTTQ